MSDYCMRCGAPHPGLPCRRDEAERAREKPPQDWVDLIHDYVGGE